MEKFFSKVRVTRGFEHKLSKYLGDSVCVCVGGVVWVGENLIPLLW